MSDVGITREGLYQLVWAEPVCTIAKRFSLTDQGLRKLCCRLAIPLPKRGHWAKVKAGHKVTPSPLPLAVDVNTVRTELTRLSPAQVSARLRQTGRRLTTAEVGLGLSDDICIDPTLQSPHLLVKQAMKLLSRKTGWTDERGIRERPAEVIAVAVTEACVTRAMILADALLKAFERKGIRVSVDANNAMTWLQVENDAISFSLREAVRRKRHEITLEETRARERYQRNARDGMFGNFPHVPMYDYSPTNELTIVIGRYPTKSWSDGKKSKLEDRLSDIVAGTLAIFAEIAEQARQKEARRVQHRQRLEEYKAKKAAYDAERTALQDLEAEAARWQRSEVLREYIAGVEANALTADRLTPTLVEWLGWARTKADWLDPRQQVCDVILDAPLPTDPGPVW